ncbi:hypothetical protein SAY87_001237 [Trapa incisa]|uniref:Uncharacterized protein n=1 Tax=Trapa incisa TaxID=236973 RepID=A0AAN7GGI7_9MYRT|nr:hypothetical protein SAY87_001237 [Trapa incisa]
MNSLESCISLLVIDMYLKLLSKFSLCIWALESKFQMWSTSCFCSLGAVYMVSLEHTVFYLVFIKGNPGTGCAVAANELLLKSHLTHNQPRLPAIFYRPTPHESIPCRRFHRSQPPCHPPLNHFKG